MRFGEPQLLWLLLLVPVLGLVWIRSLRRRAHDLKAWCAPSLQDRMAPERSRTAPVWKGLLVLAGVFFLVLAAARPQIGSRVRTVERKGIDLIVALDTSESMLAEDLVPNRITRARQAIGSLIGRLRGDRVGLVAFAGEAFVQCPLTLDYAAARMFLRFMDTDLIPVPGTAVGEAVRAAVRAFDPGERKYKVLVLITDGEDHGGNLEAAAREARDQGVRIFAVGIGTAEGVPIPMRDASGQVKDFKRDRNGDVVLSRLDPEPLRRICAETGGRYFDGSAGSLALDRLYEEISGMEEKEMTGGIVTEYEDRYGYFAGAGLLLLLVEAIWSERRRRTAARAARVAAATGWLVPWALGAAAAGLFGGASPVFAADEGYEAYSAGDYGAARDAYERYLREHPDRSEAAYNLGTALHQTGELGPAEEALLHALRSEDPALRAKAWYNLGDTRARNEDFAGAAEAYKEALRLRPQDQDAKHNLELVQRLLQQREQQSDPQQQQQQNQQDGQRDPKKQQDQEQDSEQQQQQQEQEQEQEQDSRDPQDPRQGESQQDRPDPNPPDPDPQEPDDSQDARNGQDPTEPQGPSEENPGQEPSGEESADRENPQDAAGSQEPLKISPEQARQILEGLAQQEMLLQADRLKARSRPLHVEKDW